LTNQTFVTLLIELPFWEENTWGSGHNRCRQDERSRRTSVDEATARSQEIPMITGDIFRRQELLLCHACA